MPKFINTIGRSTIAVAVCARCHFKMAHADLTRDPDTGLLMHRHCIDQSDPWRLPPRAPDRIALPNARPETPISQLTASAPEPDASGDFGPDFSGDFNRHGTAAGGSPPTPEPEPEPEQPGNDGNGAGVLFEVVPSFIPGTASGEDNSDYTTHYFTPDGSGTGHSAGDPQALTGAALDAAIAALGPGGSVIIRADDGDVYSLTEAMTLTQGGDEMQPVTIEFEAFDGSPAHENAWIELTRQTWEPPLDGETTTDVTGWDATPVSLFEFDGASYLTFRGLRVRNVTENVAKIVQHAAGLTFEDCYVENVRRFLHDGANGVSDLAITRLDAYGFSGRLFRFGSASTDGVTFTGPGLLDSGRQDKDADIVRGIAILAGQNYTIDGYEFANGSYTVSTYWNGDGISVEDDVTGVTIRNCIAHGFTDSGFDIKATGTYEDLEAYDNGANFRAHHTAITWTRPVSGQPNLRGGNGRETHFGAYGLGADPATVTVVDGVVTGSSTLAFYGTGSTGGAVTMHFQDCTIPDTVEYEYAVASVSTGGNMGYATTFDPPLYTPDIYFDDIVLLAGFDKVDGTVDYVEESSYAAETLFQNNAVITEDERLFGLGSLRPSFDTGSYGRVTIAEPVADLYQIKPTGTDAFTIEIAVMFDAVTAPANIQYILSSGVWTSTTSVANYDTRSWAIVHRSASGVPQLTFQYTADGINISNRVILADTSGLTPGVWYRLCVDFDGSFLRTYFDGTMGAKNSWSGAPYHRSGAPLVIANYDGGFATSCFQGFIDEVRITKGVARVGSDAGYTPDTAKFPRG